MNELPEKRIVCVTGPACGGKSTVASALKSTLIKKGFISYILSTDEYKKSNGKADFELLAKHVKDMLRGELVTIRHKDAANAKQYITLKVLLDSRSIIIIDGVESVYSRFSNMIEPCKTTKAYVAPTTPLYYDKIHPIETSEICMIRCLSTQFAKEKTQTVNIFSDWAKNVVDEEKCISPNFNEIDYFINTFSLKNSRLLLLH